MSFRSRARRASWMCPYLSAIGNKTVMLGVLDVGENEVESVESLVERASEALRYMPKGQLILAPDCGMLELTRASARQKLVNLVAGGSRAKSMSEP